MEEGGRKRVGIFTTFYRWDESYSLTSVVKDQLVAHVKNGYTPVLFVLESFPIGEADMLGKLGVEVRACIPQIILEPYANNKVPDTWQEDVDRVVEALHKHARDIDIMLTHDVVFINTFLPYNLALRKAELPCKYFHWIHSAPSPRPDLKDNLHSNRYTLPPNSKLVYLNNDKALALAEMYGTWLKNVRVIYNSRDPRTFWDLHPLVTHLINKYDILSADVISVFAASSTRLFDGKQFDVIVRIHEKLRELGMKTKIICCNAHANGEREKEQLRARRSNDVIFTSLEDKPYEHDADDLSAKEMLYEHGVPPKVVSDFFRLSNVFIFPSISENCSLVLLEAMLAGNLLVLNKDCSGLEEHAGAENAIFLKMGNLDMGVRNTERALETDNYLTDIAKIIRSELEVSKPLKAKRRALQVYNYDAMFNKVESLYYES
jgi:hypothetical protein